MRLVFAGTPEPAVPSLHRLAESSHTIAAVVTRNDAPLGRRRIVTQSPVALAAEELGIPVIKTDRLDADAAAEILAYEPELGVIVAYGGLVREPLLSAPPHGWINLHFSLLPRWRGAAPVQHAVIAGDAQTGAAVFKLVAGLDAGDVYGELRHPIDADTTSGDLLSALAMRGADLLVGIVDDIAAGIAVAVPQRGEPTLAPKLGAEDGRVRWNEPADAVLSRIRGVTPEPGAHTELGGTRLKIVSARASEHSVQLAPGEFTSSEGEVLVGTATEAIALARVQPSGKGAMDAGDWWRGVRIQNPVAR